MKHRHTIHTVHYPNIDTALLERLCRKWNDYPEEDREDFEATLSRMLDVFDDRKAIVEMMKASGYKHQEWPPEAAE